MDFEWGEEVERFREEVRSFLAEELTSELVERAYRTGVPHDRGFASALGARGWILPTLDPYMTHVLVEELVKAEAPNVAVSTTEVVCSVLRQAASDELKAEVLPRIQRGEVTIALGQTEPGAGSDVAAIKTRAWRDGDDWVISGQKMFTTNAQVGEYVFLLTRTDPEAPRHKGLTTFLVPLDSPGIAIQPVMTLSGERTNITYYDDVRVSDLARIGEVNRGWETLMLVLQDEHSAAFTPHLHRVIECAEAWARETGRIEQEDTRVRLARAATAAEVGSLLETRVTWMEANQQVPVAEGPMAKLFGTEAFVRFSEDLHEVAGPDALRSRLDPTAIADGQVDHGMRFAIGTAIYAGTSEIQRNIIAQHGCGLPRS